MFPNLGKANTLILAYYVPLLFALHNRPPHFPSVFSSEILEITAESGERNFFAHREILVVQSETLRSIIDTPEGAARKEIDFSDWDGDTVVRFLQYLYTGNYQSPRSILEEEEEENEFEDRDNLQHTTQVSQDQSKIGITDVLLVHAKIYALAQSKDVEELQNVALEKLRVALQGVDWRVLGIPAVTVNVIELLEYVYSHTDACTDTYIDFHKSPEPMRDLVSTFAAKNFEKLKDRRKLKLLLSEGGDLVLDLIVKISRRSHDSEDLFGEGGTRDLEASTGGWWRFCDWLLALLGFEVG